jgi:hypothetical protein
MGSPQTTTPMWNILSHPRDSVNVNRSSVLSARHSCDEPRHPCAQGGRIHAPNLASPILQARPGAPSSLGDMVVHHEATASVRGKLRHPCRKASARACAGSTSEESSGAGLRRYGAVTPH